MTTPEIITLVCAILGVLHGPLTPILIAALRKRTPKP